MARQKIDSEKITRAYLLKWAKRVGAQEDLERLFTKWDAILPFMPEHERKEMALMAILEVQSLLDIHADQGGGLTVNGDVIIPPKQE